MSNFSRANVRSKLELLFHLLTCCLAHLVNFVSIIIVFNSRISRVIVCMCVHVGMHVCVCVFNLLIWLGISDSLLFFNHVCAFIFKTHQAYLQSFPGNFHLCALSRFELGSLSFMMARFHLWFFWLLGHALWNFIWGNYFRTHLRAQVSLGGFGLISAQFLALPTHGHPKQHSRLRTVYKCTQKE